MKTGIWGSTFNISSVRPPLLLDYRTCVLIFRSPAMGFHLILLVLSTIGLLISARSSLWKHLFQDGIVYFMISFCANLAVAAFVLLNLNPIMNVMVILPAACVTASASTRSFIQMDTHITSDTHVQSVPLNPPDHLRLTLPGRKHSIDHRPGVHHVSADRDAQVIIWTCTPTNVGAKFSTSQRCGNSVQ